MKKLTLAAGMCLAFFAANAQEPILSFATPEGGTTSNDYTYGVGRKDLMDLTLTAGRTYNSVNSSNDVLINLYQATAPIGGWTFGSSGSDYATAMEMSPTSNYAYIVGQYQGTVTVPMQGGGTTTLTATGSSDVFIARFSLTGGNEGISWIKSVGGPGADIPSDVTIDPSGYPIIAGQFSQTADFDPGAGTTNTASNGLNDVFVLKLDLSGNFVWVKSVGSLANDYAGGIDADNSGNVVIGGRFGDNIDLNPGAGTANHVNSGTSEDIFITKWNSSGSYLWSHTVGANGTDYITDIDIDGNDNIIACGYFGGSFDINPGGSVETISAMATKNGLIWKLDANGVHQWSQVYQSITNNEVTVVETNGLNEIYAAGTLDGTVDFDPGAGTMNQAGAEDGFLLHMDESGTFLSLGQYGNTTDKVTIRDIALSGSEYISIVGSFDGTADMNPDTPVTNIVASGSGTDGFLVTMYNCLPTSITPDYANLPAISEECSASLTTVVPTATNQCGTTIQGVPDMTSPITSVGTHMVTWTYDDLRGNITTQTQSVTVTDGSAPTPDAANLTWINAQCQVDTVIPPTATDNCIGQITGVSNVSFPITSLGTTIITWIYADSAGNVTTQQQNVTISDTQAPIPDVTSLADLTGECSISMPTAPTATDSCSGTVSGTPDVAFPIWTQGTTVVTWTFTDNAGNTSTQTQNFTVTDTTAPVPDVANLPDLIDPCEVTGTTVTATDNCFGQMGGQTSVPFPISTPGTTVITWTFDDGNGNISTQTQNIIITGLDTSTTVAGSTITAGLSGVQYQWIDCGNGNQAITGATFQSYMATAPGSYAVVVSNGSCADTSSCRTITTIGLEEYGSTEVKVYPNPANESITISFTGQQNGQHVRVLDMSGKCIATYDAAAQQLTVDVADFASGMYLIECTQGSNVHRFRQQILHN